mmetsp:Transcript_15780/g.30512  ORF Transcript_15780/g.30512 Transcript_15780/m.30512 type:complete len:1255 (-) Transcript_15780:3-3767(-)
MAAKSAGKKGPPTSAAVLIHWINSLGTVIPEALLVDELEDLRDGVLLCHLACLTKPGVQIKVVEPIFNEEDAIKNLSAAMRIVASFDERVAQACRGAGHPSQIAAHAFGGSWEKLVVALLRALHDELLLQSESHANMAPPMAPPKASVRQQQHRMASAKDPRHTTEATRNQQSRSVARNAGKQSAQPVMQFTTKPLGPRPAWNASVAVDEAGGVDVTSPNKTSPIRMSKKPDSISKTQREKNNLGAKKSDVLSDRTNSRICAKDEDYCGPEHLIATHPGAVRTQLERLRQNARGLNAGYLLSFDWVLRPNIIIKLLRRLEKSQVPLRAPGLELNKKYGATEYVGAIFSDGILLSELARLIEIHCIGGIVSKHKHPAIEKVFVLPGGNIIKQLFYRGVNLDPRTIAARIKNVNIALEVFRSIPKMNYRHLYSAEKIVRMDPPAIIWELLEDLRSCVDLPFESKSKFSKGVEHREQATKYSSSRPAAKHQTSTIPLFQEQTSIDQERGAYCQNQKDKQVVAQMPTKGSKVLLTAGNGFHAKSQTMKVSMMPSQLYQQKTASRQASQVNPVIPPVVPPQIQFPASANSSSIQKQPREHLSPETISELASWMRDLGLSVPGEASQISLLEDPRFNGRLLVSLFSLLSDDARLLIEKSKLQELQITSLQHAISLNTAAINAMREAVFNMQPRLKSSKAKLLEALLEVDAVNLVRGREQDFWYLVRILRKAFSKIQSSVDVERKRKKAVRARERDQHIHKQLEEDDDTQFETQTERLDRTYRRRHQDIVPSGNSSSDLVASKADKSKQPTVEVTQGADQYLQRLLPYSAAQLGELETALIKWLNGLGVLEEFGVSGQIKSLLGPPALRKACSDGAMLASVIRAIQGGQSPNIRGLIFPACTPQVERGNVEKILDFLRKQNSMGRRFLFAGDGLFNADRLALLGILEDLHRFHAGALPRPSGPVPGESPFLGIYDNVEAKSSRKHEVITEDLVESANIPPEVTSGFSDLSVKVRRDAGADIWPSPFTTNDVALYSRHNFQKTVAREIVPSKVSDSVDLRDESTHSSPWGHLLYNNQQNEASKKSSASSILAPKGESSTRYTKDIVPRPSTGRSTSQRQHSDIHSWNPSRDIARPNTEPERTDEHSKGQVDAIIHWLQRVCPVPVRDIESLRDVNGVIPTLNDGTVLCALVEKLTRLRGGLPGVQQRPKTTAASLNNLRSALSQLQKNKRMPPDYLWKERELAAGKVSVWVGLLDQMRRCYA